MLETGAMGHLSVWRALGGSVDVAWFGIRQAWRWTPGLLLRLMLTSLMVALTPPRRCWWYQIWCVLPTWAN
jgi:hypothetical protein